MFDRVMFWVCAVMCVVCLAALGGAVIYGAGLATALTFVLLALTFALNAIPSWLRMKDEKRREVVINFKAGECALTPRSNPEDRQ
jgi:hypothetical protein